VTASGTTRGELLAIGTAAAGATLATRAFAQWQPSPRYPDPSIKIVDPSFARYRVGSAKIERLGTGCRWCEGPI
jgi:gluconolactonase